MYLASMISIEQSTCFIITFTTRLQLTIFFQAKVAVFPTVSEGSIKPCSRQWRVKLRNRMNGYCGEQHLITQTPVGIGGGRRAPHAGHTTLLFNRGEQENSEATVIMWFSWRVEGFRFGSSRRINGRRGSTSDSGVNSQNVAVCGGLEED